MTDFEEEQSMELEMLESIFVEEFKLISDSPKTFSLLLVPGVEETHVSLQLQVTYTPTYPDDPPTFEVELVKGLIEPQREEIMGVLQAAVEENEGMALVFPVAEALKDWLEQNNINAGDGSMFAEMQARQKAKEDKEAAEKAAAAEAAGGGARTRDGGGDDDDGEMERQRRLAMGTAVTHESFAEWLAKFDAEREVDMKAKAEAEVLKPSGREFFEMGLHRKGVVLSVDDAAAAAAAAGGDGGSGAGAGAGAGAGVGEEADGEGTESVPIDESVFLAGDDDDLSDLESDDEEDDEEDGD